MQLINTINDLNIAIIQQLPFGMALIAYIWIIHGINIILNNRLTLLGIYPRRILGLIGIISSPWIHAGFDHLFFNSIPLCILFTFMLTQGFVHTIDITINIIILGGIGTWLFGRKAIHVGASGLIMGYMGYILSESYQNRSPSSWIIGIVIFYYLGSLLLSLLPTDDNVSFEGHIFGFLAGAATSFYPNTIFYSLAYTLSPSIYIFLLNIQHTILIN